MAGHNLVDQIDSMNQTESSEILHSMPGLSPQTKTWLKQVTRYGVLKQKADKEERRVENRANMVVPMLFQLPSKISGLHNTEYMAVSGYIYYNPSWKSEKQIFVKSSEFR